MVVYIYVFQGYHYQCLLCRGVRKYFKTKYEVRRHLQDQHSGVGFQCAVCGLLFHRRNIKHSCNVTERDMEYVHRETGAFGEEARKMLVAFIQDKQDTHWKYITAEDEPESPVPVCRSVVVKPSQPVRRPNPRKETRPDSPMSLGEPEPILLEEPPRKKQRVEAATLSTLLNDLACTPSLSVDDSDVSEIEDETVNEHNVIETAVHIQKTDTYYEEEADKLYHKESKTSKGSEEKKNEKQSKRNQSETKTQEKKDEHRDTITKTHNEKQDETKKDKRKVIETQNKNDEQTRKVTETQNDKQNEASKDTCKENQNVTHKQNMIDEQTEKEIQNENEKEGNKETKSDKLKDTEEHCMTDKPRKPQNVVFENKERDESNDKDIESQDVTGEETKKDKKTDKENEMRVEVGGQNVKETQNKRKNHEPKKKDKKDKNTDKEQKKTPQEKKEAGVNKVNLKSKENKTENQRGKDMSNKKVDKMKTKSMENNKKKITLKEYEARRVDDKEIQESTVAGQSSESSMVCSNSILDDILQDITNTYNNTQQNSSIRGPTQVQTTHQAESQSEFTETLSAVASITNNSVDQVVENACGVVSDCALELVEELVITEEVDNIIDRISEEIIEEKNLRKEQKSKRKAEKRKLEQNDINEPNEKRLSECGENTDVTETEINNMGNDKDLENLKKIQGCKVVLNVGGARFETSVLTLRKDSNSLLAKLFSEHSPIIPQGNSIFLDRDASHFKLILNYLRYDGDIVPAMLPREKRHLQELLKECEYYRIQGLYKIVKRRLKHLTELYGVDC